MKHIVERFFKMTKAEVFDCFSHLPGARVYGKFIFIPGTKNERLLLVAHADTVFDGPPRGVDWFGNIAKAGDKYTLITGPAYVPPKAPEPPKVDPVPEVATAPEPPPAPTIECEAPATPEAKPEEKVEAKVEEKTAEVKVEAPSEETNGKKGKKKGKKDVPLADQEQKFLWDEKVQAAFVVVGMGKDERRIPIDEYRKIVEDELKTPAQKQEPKKPATTYQTNNNNNNSSYNYRGGTSYSNYNSRGLGADDRAGVAIAWLMRNAGHSILITDEEERGGHGAKAAARTIPEELAEHLFAIQVDRMNDQEMVFYDVSTKEFEQYMVDQTAITLHSKVGFRIERGSYTDIVDVCRAGGICGVNLAAGYWGQHTSSECFNYDAWLRTLNVVRRLCHEPVELKRFPLPTRTEAKANPTPPPVAEPSKTPTGAQTTTVGVFGDTKPSATGGTQQPSPYKDGPRFPGNTAEKTDNGVGVVVTRVDPITGVKTVERKVVTEIRSENGEVPDLFPDGSTPIKQALDDAERLVQHQADHQADGGAEVVGAVSGAVSILELQHLNAPIA